MTDQTPVDTSAAYANIASALAAAQGKMDKARKSANNPHFKSKYADLASVMDACLPALSAVGIAVTQPPGENETGRYVETVLTHGPSGERVSCRVPLIVQKNDMQGYGSAVTYARRYGLMAMAGIAPEDDDGNAAAKAAPKQEAAPRPEAVDAATSSLGHAASLDALKAIFTGLPANIRRLPAVIEAKDARKAILEQPAPQPASAGLDDEIPEFGA